MTYFHPERMPELPARRRRAARSQLEQLVQESGRRPRRVKRGVVAAAAAALMVATAAAAFAVATRQPVTDRNQARCYTVADVSGSGYYTTVTVPGRPGSTARVRDAVSMCRALFREGHLRPGVRGIDLRPGRGTRYRVPALVPCTMRNGSAAVFPGGRATCARLDLPAAGPSSRSG